MLSFLGALLGFYIGGTPVKRVRCKECGARARVHTVE